MSQSTRIIIKYKFIFQNVGKNISYTFTENFRITKIMMSIVFCCCFTHWMVNLMCEEPQNTQSKNEAKMRIFKISVL